jgi:hypothetical protein
MRRNALSLITPYALADSNDAQAYRNIATELFYR